METKTVLKSLFNGINDSNVRQLPLISDMIENDIKSTDNSLKSDSQLYLDLLSEVFAMFDIKATEMSSTEQSIAVCDGLMCLSNKYRLKAMNQLIDKCLDDLKTNIESIDKKTIESTKKIKSKDCFESLFRTKRDFYCQKLDEYYTSVKALENSLTKVGYTSALSLQSIDELKKSNEEMSNRLNDINERLTAYKHFKPNETDLKDKIKALKQQLNDYDNYFANN